MRRGLVAVAVVGTLIFAQLLAYADPPDPAWIPGFWDDADYDDVIVRATSTAGISETGWLSALAPHSESICTVSPADEQHDSGLAFAPHPSRGPPPA